MSASRTVRLFISSTFSDMEHERRVLHETVFPHLRELCTSRGATFQAVDLRWGVNEASQLDHQTMDICLGEIERCQRLSPRPNFLVLLGDRYGWEPPPARIPSDEYEALHAAASADEKAMLDQWYRQDDNAVPPEFLLLPRHGEFEDYEAWSTVEAELRDILRRAADAMGLEGAARGKLFHSATHQEITKGALSIPTVSGQEVDPAEHVLACFRTISELPRDTKNDFFDDRDSQMNGLKETIRARLNQTTPETRNVYSYEASWLKEDSDIALQDEDALAKVLLEHFERVITEDLDALTATTPLENERDAQKRFRDTRCAHFVGRAAELEAIDTYLKGEDTRVLAIIGPGGSGKSALMAEMTTRVETGVLVYRFIGATPGSTLVDGLLRSVAEELGEALGTTESIPTDRPELVEHLEDLLGQATEEHPITLVLDALDQLTEAEAENLEWLPNVVPPHAKVVVSTLTPFESGLRQAQIVRVAPMTGDEGHALLDAWLAQEGRTLRSEQFEAIAAGFAERGRPLYLRLVFQRARKWRAWDTAPALPTHIEGMVEAVLDQLEEEHTPQKGDKLAPLVQTALGYLQASRHGLSEAELLDVLANDAFFERFKETLHHPLPHDRIPMAVWSRFYLDLAPYLVEREAQGTIVLGFFHRQIDEVVGVRYGTESSAHRYHTGLADYFYEPAGDHYLDGDTRQNPNARKLAELPYQLRRSERWQELETTLTDFDFAATSMVASRFESLYEEYQQDAENCPGLEDWAAQLRMGAHLLARKRSATANRPRRDREEEGHAWWRTDRILLQLAMELPEDHTMHRAAQAWIDAGHCDWTWMRRMNARTASPAGLIRSCGVDACLGALFIEDGHVCTWDKTHVRIFDSDTGDELHRAGAWRVPVEVGHVPLTILSVRRVSVAGEPRLLVIGDRGLVCLHEHDLTKRWDTYLNQISSVDADMTVVSPAMPRRDRRPSLDLVIDSETNVVILPLQGDWRRTTKAGAKANDQRMLSLVSIDLQHGTPMSETPRWPYTRLCRLMLCGAPDATALVVSDEHIRAYAFPTLKTRWTLAGERVAKEAPPNPATRLDISALTFLTWKERVVGLDLKTGTGSWVNETAMRDTLGRLWRRRRCALFRDEAVLVTVTSGSARQRPELAWWSIVDENQQEPLENQQELFEGMASRQLVWQRAGNCELPDDFEPLELLPLSSRRVLAMDRRRCLLFEPDQKPLLCVLPQALQRNRRWYLNDGFVVIQDDVGNIVVIDTERLQPSASLQTGVGLRRVATNDTGVLTSGAQGARLWRYEDCLGNAKESEFSWVQPVQQGNRTWYIAGRVGSRASSEASCCLDIMNEAGRLLTTIPLDAPAAGAMLHDNVVWVWGRDGLRRYSDALLHQPAQSIQAMTHFDPGRKFPRGIFGVRMSEDGERVLCWSDRALWHWPAAGLHRHELSCEPWLGEAQWAGPNHVVTWTHPPRNMALEALRVRTPGASWPRREWQRDYSLRLWNLDSKSHLSLQGHEAKIRGVASSADGAYLASWDKKHRLLLWSVNADDLQPHPLSGPANVRCQGAIFLGARELPGGLELHSDAPASGAVLLLVRTERGYQLWSANDRRHLGSWPRGHNKYPEWERLWSEHVQSPRQRPKQGRTGHRVKSMRRNQADDLHGTGFVLTLPDGQDIPWWGPNITVLGVLEDGTVHGIDAHHEFTVVIPQGPPEPIAISS